jgi:hypothetical protein
MIELQERTGITAPPVVRGERTAPPVSFHHFAASRAGNRLASAPAPHCEVLMADCGSSFVRRTRLFPDRLAASNRSFTSRPFRSPLLRLLKLCDEQIHGALEHHGKITLRVRVAQ